MYMNSQYAKSEMRGSIGRLLGALIALIVLAAGCTQGAPSQPATARASSGGTREARQAG